MLVHVRRRKLFAAALAGAALAGLGITLASSHAGGAPAELAVSNLYTRAGFLTPLRPGVTYGASAFPTLLRVTAPGRSWAGSQWRTTSHGKPAFAWAAVGHGATRSSTPVPLLGVITIVTPYGRSPSVAQTVQRLRVGGSGADYETPSRVRLAGYSGMQFDGTVWGKWGHVFIPFSSVTNAASPPDTHRLPKGEAFRAIVLNVRGRTVLVFLENADLPQDQFPTFLADAGRVLGTLAFPA
jgi:hypothetical protein